MPDIWIVEPAVPSDMKYHPILQITEDSAKAEANRIASATPSSPGTLRLWSQSLTYVSQCSLIPYPIPQPRRCIMQLPLFTSYPSPFPARFWNGNLM
jgi:hypothetical protein